MTTELEYIPDRVSNCCTADIYVDTDICSSCKDHCTIIDPIEEEVNESAQEVVDELFNWRDNQFNWVRQKEIKERVKNAIADDRYKIASLEIEIARLKEVK